MEYLGLGGLFDIKHSNYNLSNLLSQNITSTYLVNPCVGLLRRQTVKHFHTLVRKAFLGFTESLSSQVQSNTFVQGVTMHFTSGGKGVLVTLDKNKRLSTEEKSQYLQLVEKRATVVFWSAFDNQMHSFFLQLKNTTTGR